MRNFIAVLLVAAALLAGWAEAAPGPLLLVLCEHFDQVCPYRIEATVLSPAAPPTAVSAPHDGVWSPSARMLYLAADFKGQPCIIPYRVDAEGAMTRVWDPIPTRDRGPRVALVGGEGSFLLAWTGAHAQVLPIDPHSALPLPPVVTIDGFDAMAQVDRSRLVTLRRGRLQSWTIAADGHPRPLGASVEAGFGACGLALDPGGHTLFVLTLDEFDRHIRIFDLAADGSVTPSRAPRPRTPQEAQKRMLVSPTTAYVVNAANTITTYARRDGELVPLGRAVPTSDGFEDMLLVGARALTVGANESAVRLYRIQPDGRLRATAPQPLPGSAAGTRLLLLP